MSDTAERAKAIVAEHLNLDRNAIADNAEIVNDLGADSLEMIELTMLFEEEFGIEIADDVAEGIATISDAVQLLERLQKGESKVPGAEGNS
ncbi:acyl carrier protein [Aurantimonas sp. A2-1-M11]|uniref:acyl carrier protein n=1 Tax=Aurantimonas sp. A2-1-M11 TaxID=3113712 RepID=UPI002F94C7C8